MVLAYHSILSSFGPWRIFDIITAPHCNYHHSGNTKISKPASISELKLYEVNWEQANNDIEVFEFVGLLDDKPVPVLMKELIEAIIVTLIKMWKIEEYII